MSPQRRHRAPAPPADIDPWDGVLLVDKPAGPTSHDVVDTVRGTFGFGKVGHGGTLDPAATGLLVLLIGRGTKLSNFFMSSDKTYAGTMRLGVATDSQDADGEVIAEAPWDHVTREMLEAEMAKYRGDIMQTPPMVSAKKVAGVPLYKHARRGKTVKREAKLIHVYTFRLDEFEPPHASFELKCTKGTYVRTICADVGEGLGCGAHLASLRRIASADLHVDDAIPFEDLLKLAEGDLIDRIRPVREFR